MKKKCSLSGKQNYVYLCFGLHCSAVGSVLQSELWTSLRQAGDPSAWNWVGLILLYPCSLWVQDEKDHSYLEKVKRLPESRRASPALQANFKPLFSSYAPWPILAKTSRPAKLKDKRIEKYTLPTRGTSKHGSSYPMPREWGIVTNNSINHRYPLSIFLLLLHYCYMQHTHY